MTTSNIIEAYQNIKRRISGLNRSPDPLGYKYELQGKFEVRRYSDGKTSICFKVKAQKVLYTSKKEEGILRLPLHSIEQDLTRIFPQSYFDLLQTRLAKGHKIEYCVAPQNRSSPTTTAAYDTRLTLSAEGTEKQMRPHLRKLEQMLGKPREERYCLIE